VIEYYQKYHATAVILEQLFKKNNIKISHNTIYKILKQERYIVDCDNKRKQRNYVRYERTYSNELWHMDWSLVNGTNLLVIIDDASRFIVGWGLFNEATTENTIVVTEKAIDVFGKPEAILTDRGCQFYYNFMDKKGTTKFQENLKNKGIAFTNE